MSQGQEKKHSFTGRSTSEAAISTATYKDDKDVVFVDAEPYDVLLGRGRAHVRHPGNIRFHGGVLKQLPRYEVATSYAEKKALTREVVSFVQKMGRFLIKQDNSHVRCGWVEIDDEAARYCVSQAFRNHRREKQNKPKEQQRPADSAAATVTATAGDKEEINKKATRRHSSPEPKPAEAQNTTAATPSDCLASMGPAHNWSQKRQTSDSTMEQKTTILALMPNISKPNLGSPQDQTEPPAESKPEPPQPPPAPTSASMIPTTPEVAIWHGTWECGHPSTPQDQVIEPPPSAPSPPQHQEETVRHELQERRHFLPSHSLTVQSHIPQAQQLPATAALPGIVPAEEFAFNHLRGLLDNPLVFTENDLFHALLRRRRQRSQQQRQQEFDWNAAAAAIERRLQGHAAAPQFPLRKRAKLAD